MVAFENAMVSGMTKGIGQDLFACVMRMPSRQRSDILEFLGQSSALPEAMPPTQKSCIKPGGEHGLRPVAGRGGHERPSHDHTAASRMP
jgi:hypothetical protein